MTGEVSTPDERPNWPAFALLCVAYLAATVGEQVLAPVFPPVSGELGLSKADGGVAFGVLALAIAVANLVGGMLLGRIGARRVLLIAAALTGVGAVIAATASGFPRLVLAQVFLGGGAGVFFPAGLQGVALAAGPKRRGFAMGLYGVAFSVALTIAALLGTLGDRFGWRLSFWVSAGFAGAAVVAVLAMRIGARPAGPSGGRLTLATVMGLPTLVGAVGAVCQYGGIPFLTTFAVTTWRLSAGAAAALLAAGRVLSILAKLISGASADRVGPRASARRTGILLTVVGLGWTLLPAGWPAYAMAAVFAGFVSSLFPVANVLAVERFGGNGTALGAYRSAQIAIGAVAGVLVGFVGEVVGLRPTLVAVALAPLTLLWWCREPGRETAPELLSS